MTRRGDRPAGEDYESAANGTIYWTLSLYIESDKVAEAVRLPPGDHVEPKLFRRVQLNHLPSFALRNAIDPLMNDIADREMRGEVQEYLLAATSACPDDLDEAAERVRDFEELVFMLPPSTSWTTEGIRFHAHPPGLDDERVVRMRRFWFAHNNGALSYHLSFSHYYGSYADTDGNLHSGYDPATYYFLSLLQKLAAPKEYALEPGLLQQLMREDDPYIDVFSDQTLNIDPLDNILVDPQVGASMTFWRFVRERFCDDAVGLFGRLARELGPSHEPLPGFERGLLDLVPFIEVPGLKVPKSRFMFLFHDTRFFDRLMPVDTDTHENIARKVMVQEPCYAKYEDRIAKLIAPQKGKAPRAVHLGKCPTELLDGQKEQGDFWDWVTMRPEYDDALAAGVFARQSTAPGAVTTTLAPGDHEGLKAAMRAGECLTVLAEDGARLPNPIRHQIPAFETRRQDCLDYLFLAGFNQNIIDFMNQDTSEVLDSIDPIYPHNHEQSDERFFVRYANHRAMISYVRKCRSLEAGNDYIGTCPYAFLIHVLALHNEFLARSHEAWSMARIERVEALIADRPRQGEEMQQLAKREPLEAGNRFEQAEFAINQAKLAEFSAYERFRYINPFRYDTERDVFATLEELRGTSRKQAALALAIRSLEDHASDLKRRSQQAAVEATANRDARLNILLGGTGVFGAGQMIYWIGEKAQGERTAARSLMFGWIKPREDIGATILSITEVAMVAALCIFFPLLFLIIFDTIRQVLRDGVTKPRLGKIANWIKNIRRR